MSLARSDRPSAVRTRPGRGLRLLLVVGVVVAFAACDSAASPTPRLTPSVATFAPLDSPSPTAAGLRTPRATVAAWPQGWADGFCTAFVEVKTVQELVVDVDRAIAEEDNDDALGLAREIGPTVEAAAEMLDQLTDWAPAQPAVEQVRALLEAAPPIARAYIRHLDDNRQRSLRRARDLAAETRPIVAETNEALAALARRGVSCVAGALELESP